MEKQKYPLLVSVLNSVGEKLAAFRCRYYYAEAGSVIFMNAPGEYVGSYIPYSFHLPTSNYLTFAIGDGFIMSVEFAP